MENFPVHTLESAPLGSQASLAILQKHNGTIPELAATLAEAPEVLDAWLYITRQFLDTSLTDEEKTVVWQTINIESNGLPLHMANSLGVDNAIIEALLKRRTLPTAKLQTLHEITLLLMRQNGYLSKAELVSFFDAGYTHQNMLEIVLGISQKIISNYVGHLVEPQPKPL